MFQRALWGAVFVGVIISSIFIGFYAFYLVMGVVLLLSLKEFLAFSNYQKKWNPSHAITYCSNGIIFLLFFLYYQSLISLYFFVTASIFIFYNYFFLEFFRKKKQLTIANIGSYFLSTFYITIPLIGALYLGYYYNEAFSGKGVFLLLFLFLMVWTNDTFAYLTGKFLGKHKLISDISPNKTIEGFLGGILFTVTLALLVNHFFFHFKTLKIITMSCIVVFSGVIGDLFASKLKREFDIKDTGNLIPGHGGVIDRFDAFFMAVPVYVMYLITY